MHSATKFIAGHSDLMAGILAVKGERLKVLFYFTSLLNISLFRNMTFLNFWFYILILVFKLNQLHIQFVI